MRRVEPLRDHYRRRLADSLHPGTGKAWSIPILAIATSLAACTADKPVDEAWNCQSIKLLIDGQSDHVVIGAEDIAIDHEEQVAYISAFDRRAAHMEPTTEGGIYLLDLTQLDVEDPSKPLAAATVTDLTKNLRGSDRSFHPHGISLYARAGEQKSLFVINKGHHFKDGDWERHETVEVFDICDGECADKLEHRGANWTFEHEDMFSPNDLVAVNATQFLVTNFLGSRVEPLAWTKAFFGSDDSYVLHFDGERVEERPRRVIDNIGMANGIAVTSGGPGDAAPQLYVADSAREQLLVYDLAEVLAEGDALTGPRRVVPVGTGVDNLDVGADGRIYVGAQPSLPRVMLHTVYKGGAAPSEVIAVDPAAETSKDAVKRLYYEDGSVLSASSVAVRHKDVMLVGSIFSDRILVCKPPAR